MVSFSEAVLGCHTLTGWQTVKTNIRFVVFIRLEIRLLVSEIDHIRNTFTEVIHERIFYFYFQKTQVSPSAGY